MAKMTLDELVAQARAIYGADLVAVALYGSAARGEHLAKHSDLNVLVVAERVTMEHLRREGPVARTWREAGNPPPLTLSRAEWLGSADIFPIEYADILAHHKVLAGALPVDGIAVKTHELRLQLEHEAMSALLRLRHAVILAGGDEKALRELLEDSVSTVMVFYRAALRLKGEAPPADSEAVCDRVASQTSLDTDAVRRILRHKQQKATLSSAEIPVTVERYLAAAQSLVGWLDAFEG